MKLENPKQCGCGKIHVEVPEQHKFLASDDALAGLYWECECRSTMFAKVTDLNLEREKEAA